MLALIMYMKATEEASGWVGAYGTCVARCNIFCTIIDICKYKRPFRPVKLHVACKVGAASSLCYLIHDKLLTSQLRRLHVVSRGCFTRSFHNLVASHGVPSCTLSVTTLLLPQPIYEPLSKSRGSACHNEIAVADHTQYAATTRRECHALALPAAVSRSRQGKCAEGFWQIASERVLESGSEIRNCVVVILCLAPETCTVSMRAR